LTGFVIALAKLTVAATATTTLIKKKIAISVDRLPLNPFQVKPLFLIIPPFSKMARLYETDLELNVRGNTLFTPSSINSNLAKRCIHSIHTTFSSWIVKFSKAYNHSDDHKRQLVQSIICPDLIDLRTKALTCPQSKITPTDVLDFLLLLGLMTRFTSAAVSPSYARASSC
jgi:hypothetical protein